MSNESNAAYAIYIDWSWVWVLAPAWIVAATVVGHYAHLEANDNGDSEEPACKALWGLGYTKEHPYIHPHNPPTLMDELKTLKKQNKIMRDALIAISPYQMGIADQALKQCDELEEKETDNA